jgi:hypothetical protein
MNKIEERIRNISYFKMSKINDIKYQLFIGHSEYEFLLINIINKHTQYELNINDKNYFIVYNTFYTHNNKSFHDIFLRITINNKNEYHLFNISIDEIYDRIIDIVINKREYYTFDDITINGKKLLLTNKFTQLIKKEN